MAGRFRYLDHRGEEVGLANAEALAFKIQTGDIDEQTLLFDATTDQWAPAGTLAIYQFVLEEIVRGKAEEAEKEAAAEKDRAAARMADRQEEVAAKKDAEAKEAAAKKEKEEEAARKKKEAEEAAAKKKEEEARKKKEAEEAAAKKKAEEEAKKKAEEERKKKEEEEARKKKEAEEAAAKKKAEEEAKKKAEEARKKKEEEEARKKKEAEEAAAKKKAEEARKKKEEEEARKKKEAEEAAAKKKAEEERKKKEEEEARKKKEAEEAAAKKKAEEEAKREAEEERKKKEEEEAKKEEAAEAEARKKEEEAREREAEEAARQEREAEEAAAKEAEETERREKEAAEAAQEPEGAAPDSRSARKTDSWLDAVSLDAFARSPDDPVADEEALESSAGEESVEDLPAADTPAFEDAATGPVAPDEWVAESDASEEDSDALVLDDGWPDLDRMPSPSDDPFQGVQGEGASSRPEGPADRGRDPLPAETTADAPPRPAVRKKPIKKPMPRPPRRKKGLGRAIIAAGILFLTVGAGSLYLARTSGQDGATSGAAAPPVEEQPAGLLDLPDSLPLPPGLQATLAEAAELALQDMVASMDSLQRDFRLQESPPPAWLGGLYLSNASRFPQVLEYWEQYHASLSAMRVEDERLFHRSLELRLRQSGAAGEEYESLLRRGILRFEERRAQREEAYDQMEELAVASMQLHDLLVRRESDIDHEPADGPTVSRDPVLEAVPADSQLNDQLWGFLNRILAALEVSQGGEGVQPVTTSGMVESLFERILATGGP